MDKFFFDSYQELMQIGAGGLGEVYLAYHNRLHKYVVIKKLRRTEQFDFQRREVDLLKNLHHPNLPQIYDFFQDDNDVYTVMDYISGHTLGEYITTRTAVPEQTVISWLEQLTNVLQYLHGQNPQILHCDIKPDNIIINENGEAVLIDFNVSMVAGRDTLRGISATYASPEQAELAGQLRNFGVAETVVDVRTDVYSLAASFYHLLSGCEPSAKQKVPRLSTLEVPYSRALTDLLDRAMEFQRERRPDSAKQLHEKLRRLEKRSGEARRLLAAQLISIILSAVLIGGGVYSLTVSGRVRLAENYRADMLAVSRAAELGDAEKTEQYCWQMLNDPGDQQFLSDTPEDRAMLYGFLADIDYARERYASAAEFYQKAAVDAGAGNAGRYWMNAVTAIIESGDLQKAQLLWERERDELGDAEGRLAEVILLARQGRAQECLRNAEELLSTVTDPELCARAAIAAAGVASTAEEELRWLERASGYWSGERITRALAVSYARLGKTSAGGTAKELLLRSLALYEELLKQAYPEKTDRYNQAIVLRLLGRTEQATENLRDLLTDYPNDYRILMQLAFTRYDAGDPASARVYCGKALESWAQDFSAEKEAADSENILALKRLRDYLGSD